MKHKKLYLYTVDSNYVNYLASFTPHLYKEKEDKRSRKYIGIVLLVNGFSYFAPLTSFKKKHKKRTYYDTKNKSDKKRSFLLLR